MAYPETVPVGVLAFSRAAGRAVSAPGYLEKYSEMEEAPYDPAGADYPLRLWDLKNIRKPRLLRGHTMPVTCADMTGCDIARDGSVAIAAEASGRVHVFSVDGLIG
jgi:hypothetical protein